MVAESTHCVHGLESVSFLGPLCLRNGVFKQGRGVGTRLSGLGA